MQYDKKPQTIDAVQVTPDNVEEIATMVGGMAHGDHVDICWGSGAYSYDQIQQGNYVWMVDGYPRYQSASDFENQYQPSATGPA